MGVVTALSNLNDVSLDFKSSVSKYYKNSLSTHVYSGQGERSPGRGDSVGRKSSKVDSPSGAGIRGTQGSEVSCVLQE